MQIGDCQRLGEGHGAKWLTKEFHFAEMQMFWNQTEMMVVQICECTATDLFTLKWLILCYVDFTSINFLIKKKK